MIDVRVEARPDLRGEVFYQVRDIVSRDYPTVEERRGVTWELALGGPQPQQQVHQTGVDGLFFRSEDLNSIAQFRVDGFTFNKLPPYTSWDEILPRALELLEVYLGVAAPRSITRVAVRYINRLRFPSRRFSEYLTTPPRGIPGTDSRVTGFLEATVAAEPSEAMVNFTQALDTSNTDANNPVVLIDIDAYGSVTLEPSTAEIRTRLEALHELKNRVFFGALTDTAVRLFA
jgi:uncharacterized protein (TIGR04255 family)